MKNQIVNNGVANLKEYGYPNVNNKNIMTDTIYKAFFLSMLQDNLGTNETADKVLNELIKEIQK